MLTTASPLAPNKPASSAVWCPRFAESFDTTYSPIGQMAPLMIDQVIVSAAVVDEDDFALSRHLSAIDHSVEQRSQPLDGFRQDFVLVVAGNDE